MAPTRSESRTTIANPVLELTDSVYIFLHGGWTADWELEGSIALGAVYSFSLPAFHWQKHSTDSKYARVRHSCNIAGNGQMVVIGGQVSTLESTLDSLIRDPWPQGFGVYDLATLSWSDGYDPDAEPYVTPEVVKAQYRVNGTYPREWTEDGVSDWFVGTSNKDVAGSSPPASHGNGKDKSTSSSSTGAIAGGVVGGVAAIAIIAAAIWFFRRRGRSRVANSGVTDEKCDGMDDQQLRRELDSRGPVPELPGAQARHEMSGKDGPPSAVEIGTS